MKVIFNGINKEIKIDKCIMVENYKNMLFGYIKIEELSENQYRIIYTNDLIDDISKVKSIEIIFDSNEEEEKYCT